jgi:hypothetical protein
MVLLEVVVSLVCVVWKFWFALDSGTVCSVAPIAIVRASDNSCFRN